VIRTQHFIVSLVLALALNFLSESPGAATAHHENQHPWWRDYRVDECFSWRGATIAVMKSRNKTVFLSVDVIAGKASSFLLPSCGSLLTLASGRDGIAYAVGRKRPGELVILARGQGSQDAIWNLPWRGPDGSWVQLAAGIKSFAVMSASSIVYFHNGATKYMDTADRPNAREFETSGRPRSSVVYGGRIFCGYDYGEWGGAVLALDANSHSWTIWESCGLPVTRLVEDSGGTLWMAEGQAHLGIFEASIERFNGMDWTADFWTAVARESSVRAHFGCGHDAKVPDWNLQPDAILDMDFHPSGAKCVLTYQQGICEGNGTKWRKTAIAGWGDNVPTSLRLLDEDTALVGSAGGGLWICRLKSGSRRPVRLPSLEPTGTNQIE